MCQTAISSPGLPGCRHFTSPASPRALLVMASFGPAPNTTTFFGSISRCREPFTEHDILSKNRSTFAPRSVQRFVGGFVCLTNSASWTAYSGGSQGTIATICRAPQSGSSVPEVERPFTGVMTPERAQVAPEVKPNRSGNLQIQFLRPTISGPCFT